MIKAAQNSPGMVVHVDLDGTSEIYNQHGSAIWHVADYMSKQFERLYHAWVLDFREMVL